jgi:hypothetical protein
MAETVPEPNNQPVVFGVKAKPTKADALRKRGLISDKQAQKKGLAPLAPPKSAADGEMANLLQAS